jgi:hypothetical protein
MWWLFPWVLFVAGLTAVMATHLLRRRRARPSTEAGRRLNGQQ